MHSVVSPNTSDEGLELQIQALGATAPRVTLADLNNTIVNTEIVKHITPSGKVLRWAVLTCQNGFAVTGRPSASVSVENDRQSIGEQFALDNARDELWALLGYELATKLKS